MNYTKPPLLACFIALFALLTAGCGLEPIADAGDDDMIPEDVQAAIWSWLQAHGQLKRVAALVQSSSLAVSLRMQGIAKGVRIRAFDNETEAEAWVLEG